LLTALALSVLVPLLAVMLVLAAVSASQAQCSRAFAAAGSGPVGGVPTALIPLFQGAAGQYQLGPHGASILAAINYVESTFGQSNLPGVHSGANHAGAEGPMQFLAGTWQTEGVNAPGDPAGQPPNVYDEADAVYSGAHYLHDLGMAANPSSWPGAVFGYNHSLIYVEQVLARASSYYAQGLATQSAGGTSVSVSLLGRSRSRLGVATRPGQPRSLRASRRSSPRRSSPTRLARGAMTSRSTATATPSSPPACRAPRSLSSRRTCSATCRT
jgi:hypothetical protein